MTFLRSIIFSAVFLIFTFAYSFVCVLSYPFPLRYRYKIVVSYTRLMIWFLKIICHINYRVHGLENIPTNKNGVILCKHQSAWETLFLPGYFHQAAIILKRELLWIPFFGWGLATIDPIAINRGNQASAMSQILKKGKACLDSGRWIIVFPEGTRIAPGKVGHYRLGGARLAVHAGYPVIPVAHNAGYFWSKRSFIKKPGTIQVVIGPLIDTHNQTAEAVLSQAKSWIEETMLRIAINS